MGQKCIIVEFYGALYSIKMVFRKQRIISYVRLVVQYVYVDTHDQRNVWDIKVKNLVHYFQIQIIGIPGDMLEVLMQYSKHKR